MPANSPVPDGSNATIRHTIERRLARRLQRRAGKSRAILTTDMDIPVMKNVSSLYRAWEYLGPLNMLAAIAIADKVRNQPASPRPKSTNRVMSAAPHRGIEVGV